MEDRVEGNGGDTIVVNGEKRKRKIRRSAVFMDRSFPKVVEQVVPDKVVDIGKDIDERADTRRGLGKISIDDEIYKKRFGEMALSKGYFGEIQLYTWDVIPFCNPDICPADAFCRYDKVGKCRCLYYFIMSIMNIVFRNFASDISEPQMYKVGMHLLPLYKMLGRLYIIELGERIGIWSTEKGDRKISPVYKEIRETIKAIEMQWRMLGLNTLLDGELPDMGKIMEGEMDGNTEQE